VAISGGGGGLNEVAPQVEYGVPLAPAGWRVLREGRFVTKLTCKGVTHRFISTDALEKIFSKTGEDLFKNILQGICIKSVRNSRM